MNLRKTLNQKDQEAFQAKLIIPKARIYSFFSTLQAVEFLWSFL